MTGACLLSFSLLGRTAAAVLLRPAAPPPVHRVAIDDPYRTGGLPVAWLKGNLHAASVRGTGRDLPKTLRDFYAGRGYRFLGIADLNTYTWIEEYQAKTLTGVPMVAATYPFGSLLALSMDHWQPAGSLQGAIDWIDRDGGFAILPSPGTPERPLSVADVLRLRHLFGIEVVDARLASSLPPAADATALWDRLLSRGERVFAFAGDDLTTLAEPGSRAKAWIEVLAPSPELASLLSAIQQGAFYASTGPAFTRLSADARSIRVEAERDATIRFIGRDGRLLAAADGVSAAYPVRGDEGYVRVELQSLDGGRAWSQPFWISQPRG